ncbi:Aste57867_11395 [Aphanomyces stellatus]|uniref:Aste57867_11395 protein n=1 Tax=Aphanomyces stellatus TaxID=120398 RepID=A0A485KSY3_9STRA|nr:hypothetical protein As57867_011353 [Aphanomyces stellatus]VFT88256.1 Aste57867_11395 [Aphanomyces stellatus]
MKAPSFALVLAAAFAAADSNTTTYDDGFAPRVVGGDEAPRGQYTWTVGLRNTAAGRSGCGGSLISPTWVLTAAHCVYRVPQPVSYIAVGTHFLEGNSDGEAIAVAKTVIHPSFQDVLPGNDIALIQLARPSKFTPIKLSKKAAVAGDSVRLLGWGGVGGGSDSVGPQSPVLKQNDFTVLANNECQRRVRASGDPQLESWAANPTHLCAGGVIGQASCKGDSGGPLVRMNADGTSSLVGDVSFGLPCARGIPDVYGRISEFVNFIDKTASGHQWDDAADPGTPSPPASTALPKPTSSPTGPANQCGNRHGVCLWPVTGQTVPYSQHDCLQMAPSFIWCP